MKWAPVGHSIQCSQEMDLVEESESAMPAVVKQHRHLREIVLMV